MKSVVAVAGLAGADGARQAGVNTTDAPSVSPCGTAPHTLVIPTNAQFAMLEETGQSPLSGAAAGAISTCEKDHALPIAAQGTPPIGTHCRRRRFAAALRAFPGLTAAPISTRPPPEYALARSKRHPVGDRTTTFPQCDLPGDRLWRSR